MVALIMAPYSIRSLYILSQLPQEVTYSSCLKNVVVKSEFSAVAFNEKEVQVQRWTQNFSC